MTAPQPQTTFPLSRTYPNRHGVPLIDRVAAAIFTSTYCCNFSDASCADACCAHGVSVDAEERQRILAHAGQLEAYLGSSRESWFETGTIADPEAPGGSYSRTRVVDGGCVFLDRRAHGCRLHAYCLGAGIDYHLLKPMLSALFPVTVEYGLLRPSAEVLDHSLFCRERGTPLYAGARADLAYYYGDDFIAELDALAQRHGVPVPPRP